MGIQFKQIDNLQETFDSVSGTLQTQVDLNEADISSIGSGGYEFQGWKYFNGNADFSGAQGILVGANNIYTPNSIYADSLNIGYPLSLPRNSTPSVVGALQVSGGHINLEDQVNIKNNSDLIVENGSVQGGTGDFDYINGSSAEFSEIVMSGNLTGFLRLYNLPDYTETGSIPAPTSGAVFRSGNHLMII
jgi:hypothetical protein